MSDPAGTHSYGYDATGQLTAANHPGAQPDESFSYDAAGNRTSGGEIYDAANRLLQDNEYAYAYDNEGNLLSKTDRALGAATTFEWDANQRQRAVTTPSGQKTEYRFDPRGRRIEVASPAGTDRFGFGISSNPLFEYDAGGSVEAAYVFGPGSDKPLAMRRGGQNHFQLQDMLANVTSLTNAAGAKVESYKYSAFGKQASPVSALGNPFSFAGREWDEESSTYYNRARQFDPNSGRFTSEDPIPSSNGYPYAGNDPVSSRDPSGLFSLTELGATTSIRGELAGEQVGFGLNLLSAINGKGPSAGDVAAGVGAVGVGAGALKLVRTIRSIRAGSRAPGLSGYERTGSALKEDAYHSFPNIIDNMAKDGSRFSIPTAAGGGLPARDGDAELRIGPELELAFDGADSIWLSPEGDPTQMAPAPGLLRRRVRRLSALNTGELEIECDSARGWVPSGSKFEAWNLTTGDGAREYHPGNRRYGFGR